MGRGLSAQLGRAILLIVFCAVALIGLLANLLINREFETNAVRQQESRSRDIAVNLSRQYDPLTGSWNAGYVHGVGMYALYEGYFIRVSDQSGAAVWDAQHHDMTLCRTLMEEIADRMERIRPRLAGGPTTRDFPLEQDGQQVGTVSVTSYGPYFFSESEFRFLQTLNLIFFIVGLLALAGSALAGWLFARRLSRPIVKTALITRQIAQGSYHIRFQGSTPARELQELAEAVNHMAESLERQETLRKRLTSDVAHELRTPLTALSAQLEAMLEGVWAPTPQRLQGCYEELGRLTGLVADLERLSQAESDNLKLRRVPVDLLELSRAAGSFFEAQRAKKKISLEITGSACVVRADPDRISQVLHNLLSNAVKYTPEHGRIRIMAEPVEHGAVLTVEDSGIGIPPEELPLIFERFYRTDRSRSRNTGGAGIGLAIARSIAAAHGGTLTAESEPDKGSRFILTLPG